MIDFEKEIKEIQAANRPKTQTVKTTKDSGTKNTGVSSTTKKSSSKTNGKNHYSNLKNKTIGEPEEETAIEKETKTSYNPTKNEAKQTRRNAAINKQINAGKDQDLKTYSGIENTKDKDISGNFLEKSKQKKQDEQKVEEANKVVSTINEVEKYQDKEYKDKFAGTFRANYTSGKVAQDLYQAVNDYVNNPSEGNKYRVSELNNLLQTTQNKNSELVGTGNAITKDLAQYLPQTVGQAKATLDPDIISAGVIIGLAGGPVNGLKAAVTLGSTKYSYDTMRGAAYLGLVNSGVDRKTAKEAATNEAVVSATIEGLETIASISLLGTETILNAFGKGGIKALTKNIGQSIAEKPVLNLIKTLAGYGINVATEGIEEEVQEAVSMENEKNPTEGILPLAKNAAKTYGQFLSDTWAGTDNLTEEEQQRIQESGRAGRTIGAMLGILPTGVNVAGDIKAIKTAGEPNTDANENLTKTEPYLPQNPNAKAEETPQPIPAGPYANEEIAANGETGLRDVDNAETKKDKATRTAEIDQEIETLTKRNEEKLQPAENESWEDFIKRDEAFQQEKVQNRQRIFELQKEKSNLNKETQTGNVNTQNTTVNAQNGTQNIQNATQNRNVEARTYTTSEDRLANKLTNEKQEKIFKAFENKYGVKVIFDGTMAAGDGGKRVGNAIHISTDTKNPVMTVFAHEFTHGLSKTKSYKEFAEITRAFMENKGWDVQRELNLLKEKYANEIQGMSEAEANDYVEEEFMCNFAADYIFADEEFVNKLAADNPTLFQRIRQWIEDTLKTITGKNKETFQEGQEDYVRFIREAKKLYDKAARHSVKNQGVTPHRFLLEEYPEFQRNNWKNSKKIIIYENDNQLIDFVRKAMADKNYTKKMYFGIVSEDMSNAIEDATGYNFKSHNLSLRAGNVRKNFASHGTERTEAPRGQRPITENDFAVIPTVVTTPDNISKDTYLIDNVEHEAVNFTKKIGNERYNVFAVNGGNNSLELFVQSMYVNEKKSLSNVVDANAPAETSKTLVGTASNRSLPQGEKENNNNLSNLGDKRYIEWAKNPEANKEELQRMVDAAAKDAGYTIKAYHGTPVKGITTFDYDKIGSTTDYGLYGSGFYFSTDKATADSYAKENGETMPVYLKTSKAYWADAYHDINQVAEMLDMDPSALTYGRSGLSNKVVIPSGSQGGQFTSHLLDKGYDSIIVQHGAGNYEIVMLNNTDIKSAEPVTYDDNGNIIPLTERFNEKSNDIRYQREGTALHPQNETEQEIADRLLAAATNSEYKTPEEKRAAILNIMREAETEKKKSPTKAERYERRTLSKFADNMLDILGADKYEDNKAIKADRKELMQKIKDGTLTEEDRRKYFDNMFYSALEEDENFIDTYGDIRNDLKNTSLTLTDATRRNITDFDKRRREFRNIRFVNPSEGGRPIDDFYAGMQEKYTSEIFPDVNTQEEMVENLLDASKRYDDAFNKIAAAGDSDELYEDSWTRFNEEVDRLENEGRVINAYTEEREAKKEARQTAKETKPFTNDEINKYVTRINQIKRDVQFATEKVLLTDEENIIVKNLLDGRTTPDIVRSQYYNADNILTVYEAKKVLQDAQLEIRQNGAVMRQSIIDDINNLLDETNADLWKDKGSGQLKFSKETAERNMEDIAGKDAKQINAYLFTPVHQHEAESTRAKNDYRERVKTLNISTKNEYTVPATIVQNGEGTAFDYIKAPGIQQQIIENKGKISESALVQLKGEGLVDDSFIERCGADVDKINTAVETMREIYGELFNDVNNILVQYGYDPIEYRKNYFPHFSQVTSDTVLGKIAKKLGYKIQDNKLPTDIAGLTESFKPGKKWFGNMLQRTGAATEYDMLKGFDSYLDGVSDVIYHTEDIQKLRQFEKALRIRFGEEGLKTRLEDLENRWKAGDLSTEEYNHLVEEATDKGVTSQQGLVNWVRDYTDSLAGKKNFRDRAIERELGRGFYDVANKLEGHIAANMVGVNPSSWTTNFIPLVQGGDVSYRNIVKGMVQTLTNLLRHDDFVNDSDFLTNRRGSERLYQTTSQKWQNFLTRPMEIIDNFTSESVTRAKYNEYIDKGYSVEEAHQKADRFAADVIADRSKGAQPTMFNARNPLTRTLTMFQIEVNNQWSHLFKDIPRNAETTSAVAMAYARFAIGAYIFNDVYEKLIGRRPALDILSWVNDFVGDATGFKVKNLYDALMDAFDKDDDDEEDKAKAFIEETSKQKGGVTLENLTSNVLQDVPFVGGLLEGGRIPISSAIPDISTISTTLGNYATGDVSGEKAAKTIAKELSAPALYLIPPVGGGQIKKVNEVVGDIINYGSYGMDNEGNEKLRFAVNRDPLTIAKGLMFGQYSIGNSQDYVDSGYNMLSAKKTDAYQSLVAFGMKPTEAEKTVRNLVNSKGSKLRNEINSLDLTVDQKNALGKVLDPDSGVNYAKPETIEYANLPAQSRKAVDKIKTQTGSTLKKAMEAYADKSDTKDSYDDATTQALDLLEEGYTKAVLEELGYSTSEYGAIARASGLNEADISADEYYAMLQYADTDLSGNISQEDAKIYLKGRKDLTNKQKYYIMKALVKTADKNNPWYKYR